MDDQNSRLHLLDKIQQDFERAQQRRLVEGLRANENFPAAREVAKQAADARAQEIANFGLNYELRKVRAIEALQRERHARHARPHPKGVADPYLTGDEIERLADARVRAEHEGRLARIEERANRRLEELAGLREPPLREPMDRSFKRARRRE